MTPTMSFSRSHRDTWTTKGTWRTHGELSADTINARRAPDGMMMVDEQGLILLVNRQIEALFGYAWQDLVGQPLEVLLPDSLRRAHRSRFRAEAADSGHGARGCDCWADGPMAPSSRWGSV